MSEEKRQEQEQEIVLRVTVGDINGILFALSKTETGTGLLDLLIRIKEQAEAQITPDSTQH